MSSEENAVLEQLSNLSLESKTYSHAAAFTVEEQTKEIAHLDGSMTKNLFLKDKKQQWKFMKMMNFLELVQVNF